MKQFNGRYGCSMCFAEGASPEGLPMLRYYPFDSNCIPRTNSSLREDGRTAAITGDDVRGVKGSSALAALNYVDLANIFPVDWMHAVLLGVTRTLLSLWLNKEHKNKEHYIGDKIALLDNRLLHIKIPDFVARRQRSLEDHSHWKATECREWLLHFSIPILTGVLKSSILTHYALLVSGVALLTQELIREADVVAAEEMLLDFCCLFPTIYGIRKQSMNVHVLTHLPQCVQNFGPLFTFSCFGFESMNAHLKRMVHGTGHINDQISFAVGMTKTLPNLLQQIVHGTTDGIIEKLASKLSSKFTRDESVLTNTGFECVGKRKQLPKDHEDMNIIINVCEDQDESTVYQFFRLKNKTTVIHSKVYGKDRTKNSYCIKFSRGQGDEFGLVLYYLEVNQSLYAMLDIYNERKDVVRVVGNTYPILAKYRERLLCQHVYRFSKIVTKKLENQRTPGVKKVCIYGDGQQHLHFLSTKSL